jgi:tRNA dimethylallyltransferase
VQYDFLVVLGPTASGKTRLAVQLAEVVNGEIISADSRQVFRGMDIGTGKDLAEYGAVPYHLIDILDPGEDFDVFKFQQLFLDKYTEICERGRLPILAGGTGMYLESVLKGYRMQIVPENRVLRDVLAAMPMEALALRLSMANSRLHNSTDLLDRARLTRAIEISEYEAESTGTAFPVLKSAVLGIRWERSMLRRRITDRLQDRLKNGLIEEVERLHIKGVSFETLEFYGLEYRFVARYLQGELSKNDMFQKLNSAIHDFAKRQETWFRRMERNGILIHWVDGAGEPLAEALQVVQSEL